MATIQGIIHGKTIELEKEPGLPDGQAVAVTIEQVANNQSAIPHGALPDVENWCQRIVFDSAVSPTEKVVKGTRLLAEALAAELHQGKSADEMQKAHPELTAEDVAAVQEYARTPIGLRQSFGAWADDAEGLDEYLGWTRQQRKINRREIEE